MEDIKEIKEVKRKRAYRSFDSRIPRLRTACPICKSINVQRRKSKNSYVCDRCGWQGEVAIKVEY